MIRGKATEYVAYILLRERLEPNWIVTKLNLNPQQNQGDEDLSIRHRRTGKFFRVESKNAVRGSFRLGSQRTRIKTPHFRIKCHKSRSNVQRLATTNDRYTVDSFDIVIANLSNALFGPNPLTSELLLVEDQLATDYLKAYFGVNSDDELIKASYDCWVCCFSKDIADEHGVIPRSPSVRFPNDSEWFSLSELSDRLDHLLVSKH